jgi:hypothetical protein
MDERFRVVYEHQLPADFIGWKGHMSIQATAVVKKETKVDPKKPEDKVHYASLCVLNEDGKEYGPLLDDCVACLRFLPC